MMIGLVLEVREYLQLSNYFVCLVSGESVSTTYYSGVEFGHHDSELYIV